MGAERVCCRAIEAAFGPLWSLLGHANQLYATWQCRRPSPPVNAIRPRAVITCFTPNKIDVNPR